MLKRIKPRSAKLGMYIHGFEGAFADRPFWRTRFLLTDPIDLDRLRRSSIDAVIIDSGKSQSGMARGASPVVPLQTPSPRTRTVLAADPERRGFIKTVERAKREMIEIADDVRLGRPIAVAKLAPMLNELLTAMDRNSAAFLGILRLKTRDEYTYLHSVAVSALMMNFSRMLGLPHEQMMELGMAGLLHDVGKLAMPADILEKAGPLAEEEFEIIKRHPQAGVKILSAGIGVPAMAFEVCLHHHERVDGMGYPSGLRGDELSLTTRMGAICDVYDALTSDRVYKDAWTPQLALSEMQRWSGHFDPVLLKTFMRSLGIYPIGTLVRLRESSLCIVVADNLSEPTLPTVRSFYSIATRTRVHPEDIRITSAHVISPADPAEWGLNDWDELRVELLAFCAPSPTGR